MSDPGINATNWSGNPDWIPAPYLFDDDRILFDDPDFLFNGIITQPKWTTIKPTNWTKT